jgi:hypothetical protein
MFSSLRVSHFQEKLHHGPYKSTWAFSRAARRILHPFECIIPLRLSRTSACGHNPALPFQAIQTSLKNNACFAYN